MKRIIASVGLAALSTATLSAQYAPGLTRMEAGKPWSVSASLRGFYDDNVNTRPSSQAVDSYGMEFSPAAALNFSLEQTYLRLGYVYSLRYYDAIDEVDHSHEVTAKIEHRLSERFKIAADDSFVYSQEPDIVTPAGTGQATFVRAGNVFRNRGAINFTGQITPGASLDASYQNVWYDYQNSPYSETLDRFEHRLSLDGGWQFQETLVGILGYTYGINDYSSESFIPSTTVRGTDRNNTSHYFYGGFKRALTAQLSGSAKVGGQYTSYDIGESAWNPYADLNLTYSYLPGSSVQAGFRHDRNATDVIGVSAGNNFVLDQESTTIYGQLTHQIAVNLAGSLLGQFQHGTFNGGTFNDQVDNFFLFGANLEYKFTQHWSSEVGYNFDRLDSDLGGRSFSRNRIYIGVRASY